MSPKEVFSVANIFCPALILSRSSGFFIVLKGVGVGVGVGVGLCNERSALVFDTGILLFMQPERKTVDMRRERMVIFLIRTHCSKLFMLGLV